MLAVTTDELGIDEFDEALQCALASLRAAADRDWKVPAGTLTWTCWRTLEHVVDVLYSYAFQIASRVDRHPVGRPSCSGEFANAAASVGPNA